MTRESAEILWECDVSGDNAAEVFASLRSAWQRDDKKVFVLHAPSVTGIRGFYEEHFGDIGTVCRLATLGGREQQRTGEIWTDVRYDPNIHDAYRHSPNPQPLHTDGSYIPSYPNATMMLCFAPAGTGGETIFLDAEDLVAIMEEEEPELLRALESETLEHARSGDRRSEPVIDRRGPTTLVNWNYYCVDPDIPAGQARLKEHFFEYLGRSDRIRDRLLQLRLNANDAVLWKDRQLLHGRNAFSGHDQSVRHLAKCAIDVGVVA